MGRWLEGDDLKAGNRLEVAHVESHDIEAKMQGRGSDHEIREIDADALAHLLAVEAPWPTARSRA